MGLDVKQCLRSHGAGLAGMTRVLPAARSAPVQGRRAWLAERSNGARLHAGVDLTGAPGTPVVAPEAGRVALVLPDANAVAGWRGYGPGVVLLHGESGAFHNLAHVVPGCRVGDIVQAGAQLAAQSELRHVHWEVRAVAVPTAGRAVVEDCADPLAWQRGELVRWDGRCPRVPGNTHKTPRACRPSWRGPRPAPLVPWPSPSSSPSSSPPTSSPRS